MSGDLTLDQYQTGAAKTAIYPRVFTEQQIVQMAGVISGALPQLHTVELSEILDAFDFAMEVVETPFNRLVYPVLGLVGEAGELANKVKKIARDDGGDLGPDKQVELADELGDTLWYDGAVASALQVSLGEVGQQNLDKLADRMNRGVIKGSGDRR